MSFLTIFTQEKGGRFSVLVPALRGCFSEGDTLEDAKKNIQEAIELYLEEEEESVPTNNQMVVAIDLPEKNYA